MELISKVFKDDGIIPNSSFPVIIYKEFVSGKEAFQPEYYETLLNRNGWGGGWRNGLFGYHHYHSTAHEVLCIYGGWADALLGGEGGQIFRIEPGDVIILPAGTGHKNVGQGGGFAVVGAYPAGQHPDMNYGRPGERPDADMKISAVELPPTDPVLGGSGGLVGYWSDSTLL